MLLHIPTYVHINKVGLAVHRPASRIWHLASPRLFSFIFAAALEEEDDHLISHLLHTVRHGRVSCNIPVSIWVTTAGPSRCMVNDLRVNSSVYTSPTSL